LFGLAPSPEFLGVDRVATVSSNAPDVPLERGPSSLSDLPLAAEAAAKVGRPLLFVWEMELDGGDLVGQLAAMGSVLTRQRPRILSVKLKSGNIEDAKYRLSAVVFALRHLELRRGGIRLISCPQCARSKVDFRPIAERISEALKEMDADLDVAVMGCEVNGPGEARMADVGVACGEGCGVIFKKGKVVRKVPEAEIVPALLEEIRGVIR
jgi:4-hydroxy-3-methylbut-2-en-1-yl diphosphate synthase IspG/GcpE